ncbi:MAG: hypothetical protein NVSMB26_09160 [Beijerinckiaceae bacterium]
MSPALPPMSATWSFTLEEASLTRSLAEATVDPTSEKSPCEILRTAALARRVVIGLGGRILERIRLVPASSSNNPAGCARAALARRSLKAGV